MFNIIIKLHQIEVNRISFYTNPERIYLDFIVQEGRCEEFEQLIMHKY